MLVYTDSVAFRLESLRYSLFSIKEGQPYLMIVLDGDQEFEAVGDAAVALRKAIKAAAEIKITRD